MKGENLSSLAQKSALAEKSDVPENKQYEKGFYPCREAVGSEAKLAHKAFGQIDQSLVENGP